MRRFALYFVACVCLTAQNHAIPGFDEKAIDRKADPCSDFYQFACGAWMAANPIPPEQSRWGRFDEIQERNRAVLRGILESEAKPGPERDAITMRVHERGAGLTEACGTGAAAAAWAATNWRLVDRTSGELTVHMDGGDARVALHVPEPGRVTLTGPATFVGTIEIP